MKTGLPIKTVKLKKHHHSWSSLFAREKESILKLLGNQRALSIEHVGSTAIPGMQSKPIIDINVAVNSLVDIADFIEKLPQLGYQYIPHRSYPNTGYKNRAFFVKGEENNRTHHLKLLEQKSEAWINPILFRDYLIKNKQAQDDYKKLKQQLADQYPDSRREYTKGKSAYIEYVLQKIKNT
ncbi:GrpB family protein [Patescibacteria group bacterium]